MTEEPGPAPDHPTEPAPNPSPGKEVDNYKGDEMASKAGKGSTTQTDGSSADCNAKKADMWEILVGRLEEEDLVVIGFESEQEYSDKDLDSKEEGLEYVDG